MANTNNNDEVAPMDATPTPLVPFNTNGLLPEKFNGNGFKNWQQKMYFYLTSLNLTRFLKEDKPETPEGGETDAHTVATLEAWKHSDFLCRGWILSRLVDNLYSVYNNDKEYPTAKHLWMALEKKYKSENTGFQRYAVAKLLEFKMVDSRSIMDQVEQLQLINNEITAEGMILPEAFIVDCTIEKLPPSWVDFKNYLKHKRKQMSLESLISRLHNEATIRLSKNEERGYQAYLAEQLKAKGKGKVGEKNYKFKNLQATSSTSFKKHTSGAKKFGGKCHKCGKIGHKPDMCRSKPIQKRPHNANLTEADLCCVVTDEVNTVEGNPLEWWYDTGATAHICKDKAMFNTYQQCHTNEKIMMGDIHSTEVAGHGKVILKLTSGHEITLTNVRHVPNIRKNLISGTLLSKAGFSINFHADKLVLKKNGVYLGKGFVKNGLIKMNVMTVIPKAVTNSEINNNNPVAYLVESFTIWHERLGHVNYKSLTRLMD